MNKKNIITIATLTLLIVLIAVVVLIKDSKPMKEVEIDEPIQEIETFNLFKIKEIVSKPKDCSEVNCQESFLHFNDKCCSDEKLESFSLKLGKAKVDDYAFFSDINIFQDLLHSILTNSGSLEISKGYFDFKTPDKEIIVATVNSPEDGHLILIMDEAFNVNILVGKASHILFKNNPLKLLDDLPEFFVGELSNSKRIYHINDLELISSGNTPNVDFENNNIALRWNAIYKQFIFYDSNKIFANATEIVTNNAPDFVEFWTEAYCPGTGTPNDYEIPEGYSRRNITCDYGAIGSHGGCPTCVMSKITLSRDNVSDTIYRMGNRLEPLSITGDLTDAIFYSDEKLIDYLIDLCRQECDTEERDYCAGFDPNYVSEVQRGKFDILNDNDVALVSFPHAGDRIGHSFIIERKRETFTIDRVDWLNYHIGYALDIKPRYFLHGEKPFFAGNSGNASTGGCIEGYDNIVFFRIYEGKLKYVFYYEERDFKGEVYNKHKSLYEENGVLVITGYSEKYIHSDECDAWNVTFCERCEGDTLVEESFFEVYKWSEVDQTFKLMDEVFIEKAYNEFVLEYGSDASKWSSFRFDLDFVITPKVNI